jgi:hypothetical protein
MLGYLGYHGRVANRGYCGVLAKLASYAPCMGGCHTPHMGGGPRRNRRNSFDSNDLRQNLTANAVPNRKSPPMGGLTTSPPIGLYSENF